MFYKKTSFVRVMLSVVVFSFMVLVPTSAYASKNIPVTQVRLVNPIGGTDSSTSGVTDIRLILGNAVFKGLAVAGSLTLLVFLVGGAYWLLSAGNAERVKKGTETMIWAVIGLFVIFGAYGIIYTLISGLTGNASLENTSVNGTSETQVTTDYYQQVDGKTISLWVEPKTNVVLRSTIPFQKSPGVNCIVATGKQENNYIEIKDPTNPTVLGWVLSTEIQRMTSQDVSAAGCGGPSPVANNTASQTSTQQGEYYKYGIRTEPTSSAKATEKKLKKGSDCILVTETKGQYYHVFFENVEGWASKNYLVKTTTNCVKK